MATSKIANAFVPGAVIASSTGNKTYSAHLDALQSSYAALDKQHRQRCAVKIEDSIYKCEYFGSVPSFSAIGGNTIGTELICDTLRIKTSGSYWAQWTIKTTGNTVSDKSSTSYNGTVSLVYA